MTDQNSNPAQGAQGQGTTSPAANATTQPQALAHDFQRMTLEQFNARLQAEREAGAKGALGAIGVESVDVAKARVAKAAELERASLSESEKAQARIKELEPAAANAAKFEEALKRQLKATLESIPEAKRGLLDLAPAETDPVARLDWITNARAKGLFNDVAPATPAVHQAANSKAGMGAPPTPSTSQAKPTHELTKEEFEALKRERLGKR